MFGLCNANVLFIIAKNETIMQKMYIFVQRVNRSQQYKSPPPHTEPIDIAAHLKLLGDSLSNVGRSLINQAGVSIYCSTSFLYMAIYGIPLCLACFVWVLEESAFVMSCLYLTQYRKSGSLD